MSISPATLTNEPDEGMVAGLVWVPAPDTVRGPEPSPITPPSTPTVPSPPRRPAHQEHFEDLGFLESARMDREMARELHQSARRRSSFSITAALLNMSNARFLTLAAGLLMLTVGLLALRFPVFLDDFDQWGFQINCGSGFADNLTQAGVADSAGTDFVDQCHAAVAWRRDWAIPLAVAGALLIGGLLVRPPRQPRAAVEIDLMTVYPSIPSVPSSRPYPLALTPPKGANGSIV
jgi:hypothetical protein